jgi:hypothetical protein
MGTRRPLHFAGAAFSLFAFAKSLTKSHLTQFRHKPVDIYANPGIMVERRIEGCGRE